MSCREGSMFGKTTLAMTLLTLCFIGTGASFAFAASGSIGNAQEHHDETAVSPEIDGCPVSGEEIRKETNITYEYKGKTYRFCCPDCAVEFKKNPDKYIEKMKKMENP